MMRTRESHFVCACRSHVFIRCSLEPSAIRIGDGGNVQGGSEGRDKESEEQVMGGTLCMVHISLSQGSSHIIDSWCHADINVMDDRPLRKVKQMCWRHHIPTAVHWVSTSLS